LVRERAEAIIRASVDDPHDPFALVRIDGEELAGDPLRLVDEANTVPLLGGRRAVAVRAGSRNIVPAVEALLAAPGDHCRVVIEAGDLKRNAALRALCEKSSRVAAIACYPDDERTLVRLVDSELQAAGLAIESDAKAALVNLLGGDRRASLSEIRKLALYAEGKTRIVLDDVVAVTSDASSLATDTMLDAALAGRLNEVGSEFAKACVAGTAPSSLISAALRHVSQLHRARLMLDARSPLDQAAETVCGKNFRRKPMIETILKSWTADRLEAAMQRLAEAVFATRLQANLAEPIVEKALLDLAVEARRKK
jgi:DNA polymerase-3 subunit delta